MSNIDCNVTKFKKLRKSRRRFTKSWLIILNTVRNLIPSYLLSWFHTPRRSFREFPIEVSVTSYLIRGLSGEVDRKLKLLRIEKLRRMCRRLNGIVLKSGELFSLSRFGISDCQFNSDSDPIFEACLNAGFEALDQSNPTMLKCPMGGPFLIEARLTPDELVVKVRVRRGVLRRPGGDAVQLIQKTHLDQLKQKELITSTTSMSATPKSLGAQDTHICTAAILDCHEPEFASFLMGESVDYFFIPKRGRPYNWSIPKTAKIRTAWFLTWVRLVYIFFKKYPLRREGYNIATRMSTSSWLVKSFARQIPWDVEHVIVAQEYLPYLWKTGALGGRTFDVLLTRPPLAAVHEKLDLAALQLPYEKVLKEFRCSREIVEAESEAFVYADRVITPHDDFAQMFPNLRKLEWYKPAVEPPADVRNPRYLLFPKSLRIREGAQSALAIAEATKLPLLVVGSDQENLCHDTDDVFFVKPSDVPWHEIAAIVHPTLFESWPRLHLHALALGIPVVVTESAGLSEGDGVYLVPFHNEEVLLRTIERAIRLPTALVRNEKHLDELHKAHTLI